MSYTVTSGFPFLDGECEIDGDQITSYHSNTLGKAKIEQLGGPDLHCIVTFEYHIHAHSGISGFQGHAEGNVDDPDIEETWAATATGQPAVAAKGNT